MPAVTRPLVSLLEVSSASSPSHSQKHAAIIEPFSQASKTQIALINFVQVYCYENTKVMKAFPQILKVRSISRSVWRDRADRRFAVIIGVV